MPFHYKFSRTPGLLRLHVWGTRVHNLVVEEAKVIWTKLAEELEKDFHNRVLATIDVIGHRSIFEAYQIFENPGKFKIKRRSDIAIVYLNYNDYEVDKFAETVARNRAWNIMTFTNEADAHKWLDEQQRN